MNEKEITTINLIAEKLQSDCHKAVELILKDTNCSYEDATNVWIFRKLAEIELRMMKLESPLFSIL